jgi:hypothetical protein
MSTEQTPADSSELAVTPAELTPQTFNEYFITTLVALAQGQREKPLHLGMVSKPGSGLRLMLIEGGNVVKHTLLSNLTLGPEREAIEVTFGPDEARVHILEMWARWCPTEYIAAWDQVAALILNDITTGGADVADAVWLTHWVRLRADAPMLDFNEAERLYNSTPQLNLSDQGPVIVWPEPGALLGQDPEFEARMETAQKIATHELNQLLVKFAGSVHAAFMFAGTRRKGNTPPSPKAD